MTLYDWTSVAGKRTVSKLTESVPDIDSTTKVEDLYSGKYMPKSVQSIESTSMQDEQKRSKTMTTSVRYNRHLYTVKVPMNCPLEKNFTGK